MELRVHSEGRERIPDKLRKQVMERDKGTCQYCGDLASCLDHVVPSAFGGTTKLSNLVAACQWCNGQLGGRVFDGGTPEKKLFISERLHLKTRWFRKNHTICGDCKEIFRPNINGASELLCADCYESDSGGSLWTTDEEKRAYLKQINSQLL